MHGYLFALLGILEVLDVLDDVTEFLLPAGLRFLRGLLVLRERGVVGVDLLAGVHEILVVAVRIAHLRLFQNQCYL